MANHSMTVSGLAPMLTVKGADAAIGFYERAFGANVRSRFEAPSGHVVAEMAIGEWSFYVVDENREAFNLSPAALGGTTVRLSLMVDDADAVSHHAVAAGASVIFPVADQPYGMRQGRVQDPFGHHWLIGTPLP